MAEKKLLLLETNFDVARKYEDILKESVWKISHKDSLNTFLASMKEDEFDVAVVEGGIVPEKIIAMVSTSKPVIICSDSKSEIDKVTVIPRNFSGSDLVNALGKVSFMKVAGTAMTPEEQDYLIEETISQDKPVVLEPVTDGEEEAELLTPEDSDDPVRSSWEIEKEEVDVEAPTLVDDGNVDVFPEPVYEDQKESKQDIFEKIDEIDSIIMSINKDVDKKSPEEVYTIEKAEPELTNPFGKEEESADFLFDDNFKYEDNSENKIGKVFNDEDVTSSRVSDFESILAEDPEQKGDEEKPLELDKSNEAEAETIQEYQDSFDEMTDLGEVDEKPEEEVVELTPESVAEPELVAEPEPVVAPEPIEGDVLKAEFKKWLDENAREIIKEVVEEQLKELYGRKRQKE